MCLVIQFENLQHAQFWTFCAYIIIYIVVSRDTHTGLLPTHLEIWIAMKDQFLLLSSWPLFESGRIFRDRKPPQDIHDVCRWGDTTSSASWPIVTQPQDSAAHHTLPAQTKNWVHTTAVTSCHWSCHTEYSNFRANWTQAQSEACTGTIHPRDKGKVKLQHSSTLRGKRQWNFTPSRSFWNGNNFLWIGLLRTPKMENKTLLNDKKYQRLKIPLFFLYREHRKS